MASLSFDRKASWTIDILGLVACVLSIIHVSLRAKSIELIYIAIISVLVSILFIFIMSIIRKSNTLAKGRNPYVVFLFIYILLIIWLALNKTIIEYREIIAFEEARSDLAYGLNLQREGARWDMAKLYQNAPLSIHRIEAGVKHKGTMMMHPLLREKIRQGEGIKYRDDMYELAEVAFLYGKKFAKKYYEKAYMYGRKDALARYHERMLIVNPKYEVSDDITDERSD